MRAITASAALSAVLGLAAGSQAGTITTVTGIGGGGLGSAIVNTIHTSIPNNDNWGPGPSPNIINISKVFQAVAPIDIEFEVLNSQGTTEYYLESDSVTNFTGVDWYDYHFQLGFFLGNNFVKSNLFDFLDFDTPDRDPTPTSSIFTILDHQANDIGWSGGIVRAVPNAPNTVVFTLSIDIPDADALEMPDDALIRDAAGNVIGYRFTLRQFPTIPEPSSFMLVGLGALGLFGLRRRRRS